MTESRSTIERYTHEPSLWPTKNPFPLYGNTLKAGLLVSIQEAIMCSGFSTDMRCMLPFWQPATNIPGFMQQQQFTAESNFSENNILRLRIPIQWISPSSDPVRMILSSVSDSRSSENCSIFLYSNLQLICCVLKYLRGGESLSGRI